MRRRSVTATGIPPRSERSKYDGKPRYLPSGFSLSGVGSGTFETLRPKKRAHHGVWRGVATVVSMGSRCGSLSAFTRPRHGLWEGGLST